MVKVPNQEHVIKRNNAALSAPIIGSTANLITDSYESLPTVPLCTANTNIAAHLDQPITHPNNNNGTFIDTTLSIISLPNVLVL